jgi:predicted acylesterase/phospholipase RssA
MCSSSKKSIGYITCLKRIFSTAKMASLDTIEQPDNIISYDYDTLVISGGSSKSIVTLGALQYMYDNFLLNKVTTYIGTSAGSMICYLLAIGYTPQEILVYICTHQLLEKLQHFDIVEMINGRGASSFNTIHEQLEKMTIAKIGGLITLQDLQNRFGIILICITHNLTENRTEYLSPETHPDLPCLNALRMSSNLPLVFETYKYGNNFYIDGGISDNFGIDIGDIKGNKIMGVLLTTEHENFTADNTTPALEFIYKLMFIPISQAIEHKLLNVTNKCKIVKLRNNSLKFFDFNISPKIKLELFSDGYQQAKTDLE